MFFKLKSGPAVVDEGLVCSSGAQAQTCEPALLCLLSETSVT